MPDTVVSRGWKTMPELPEFLDELPGVRLSPGRR